MVIAANALRPFKIYCASPSVTSQLVLFLWQTVEIGPLKFVRVVEALQNFVQKWSLQPDALRPFKIHCASPSITSQLILFLWQTVLWDM